MREGFALGNTDPSYWQHIAHRFVERMLCPPSLSLVLCVVRRSSSAEKKKKKGLFIQQIKHKKSTPQDKNITPPEACTAMHPVARVFATVYIFLMIFLSWVLIWIVQTIVKALIFPFTTKERQQDICGHIFRRISFVFADVLNPFWKGIVLKPFPKLAPGTKFIVALNHLSNADPWFAIRPILPYDCKWICKGVLFKVPFGGWGLSNNGDLAIHFTSEKGGWGTKKGSVGTMMEQAKALIHRGQPIAVFPEGYRNPRPEGPLQEFKPGFFKLAVEENAVIVPIALSGSEKAWPKGDWKFNTATCYFTCGEPIPSTGLTAEELCEKVKQAISEMRESHPDRVKSH